jgi:DegV family protein with EDD domain
MTPSAQSLAIVTDSTSDIPQEVADKLKITIIPAILTMEGETYRDGKDITREEFYRRLPQLSTPPTTAVPSPLAFEEAYQKLFEAGCEKVLSIHLSPKLSGMINVVNQAAQAFADRVTIFDSKQVSLGLGFQVIEAAEAVQEGMSLQAVLNAVRKACEKVRLIAMIDTQEYLRRSGRVSWVRAGLGKMLRLRLLLEVVDGVIERRGIIRTRRRAVDELITKAESWGSLKRLAILHTAAAEDAKGLVERLRQYAALPPLIVDVTTLLGAHVGPASLGVAGQIL